MIRTAQPRVTRKSAGGVTAPAGYRWVRLEGRSTDGRFRYRLDAIRTPEARAARTAWRRRHGRGAPLHMLALSSR